MNEQIQISSWLERSVAHGPGERFVLWVQGCTLGCAGCFSPHTHDRRGGKSIAVCDLANVILATRGIEGITISGGEPLLQVSPLAVLADIIRRNGLTVMCYTGFTLQELRSRGHADVERFLRGLDILVDGRFCRTPGGPAPLAG